MIPKLVEIYCLVDNLTRKIDNFLQKSKVGRKSILSRSELILIALIKQIMGIKTNKVLYDLIKTYGKNIFSALPSYQQFCSGLESNVFYLAIINQLLAVVNSKKKSNFFIIDSTSMPLCRNAYRSRSKLGKNVATSGKNMNGWYFGFKLHLIITDDMDIVSFKFTRASTSDITALDTNFVQNIAGYLIGDKGYIGVNKAKELRKNNVTLITKSRKNMKKTPVLKKILKMLSQRQVVETTFSMLKSKFSLIAQHVRSLTSFFSQALTAIFAHHLHKNKVNYYLEIDILNNITIS